MRKYTILFYIYKYRTFFIFRKEFFFVIIRRWHQNAPKFPVAASFAASILPGHE